MKRTKKYTLIELLVAMLVLSVFMIALMQFFMASQNLISSANSRTSLFERARIAMDMISMDIQTAYYGSMMIGGSVWDGGDHLFLVTRRPQPLEDCETPITIVEYVMEADTGTLYSLKLDEAGDASAGWDDVVLKTSANKAMPNDADTTTILDGLVVDSTINAVGFKVQFSTVTAAGYVSSPDWQSSQVDDEDKKLLPVRARIEISVVDDDTLRMCRDANIPTAVKTDQIKNSIRHFSRDVYIDRGKL